MIILDIENKSNVFCWWTLKFCLYVGRRHANGDQRRKVFIWVLQSRRKCYTLIVVLWIQEVSFWDRVLPTSGVGRRGSKIPCLQNRKRPSTPLTSLVSTCIKIKVHVPLLSLTPLPFYTQCLKSHLSVALLLPGQHQPPLPLFWTPLFPFLSLCSSLIRLARLRWSCSLSPVTLSLIAISYQFDVLKMWHLPCLHF